MLVPKLHLGTKISAKLCLAGKAFQAQLGNEKSSQTFLLFWNFLPVYVTRGQNGNMEQPRQLSKEKRSNCFCSATAAVLRWIFLEIKGVAGKTPPVPGGAKAAQFPQFSLDGETPGLPIGAYVPK